MAGPICGAMGYMAVLGGIRCAGLGVMKLMVNHDVGGFENV